MFAKRDKFFQWNAVDVVRSDGEVLHGLVVDKRKSHLLVDFDIAGQEPELVPCQNAYLSNDCTRPDEIYFGITGSYGSVMILRKTSKDQPWKWCSGEVVLAPYSFRDFALVKIRTGEQVIMDCIRSHHVRKTAYSGRPMRRNDFVREECSVPDGFLYDAHSVACWRKHFPRTLPIGMVGNMFRFLQLRCDKDFDIHKMASALSDGISKEREMETMEDNRGTVNPPYKIHHRRFYCIKRPHTEISNYESDTLCTAQDWSFSDLPLDVFGIVLSFLNGRQQTRLRPVCAAWNFTIISPTCSREMIVDLGFYEKEKERNYILGVWLFRCITQWTRYVTITVSGIAPDGYRVLGDDTVMAVLRNIVKFKSPLLALILYNIEMESINIITETAISENIWIVCSRLIFKDVTILNLFTRTRRHFVYHLPRTNSPAHLRIPFGSVGSQKEWLDCIERVVTDFTDPKHRDALERVSKVVAGTSDEYGHPGDTHRRSEIIDVLKHWQQNDVRFGPETEWKHAQLAQLAANLLSLRNTTLLALVCLADQWKR